MIVDSVNQATNTDFVQTVESVNTDNFGPEAGWEFEFAAEHDILYPLMKTGLDLLPGGWLATPSGRRQFTEASLGGKALTLGLDIVSILPVGLIGKGLKITAGPIVRPLVSGVKKLPFMMKELSNTPVSVVDSLMRKVDNFVEMDEAKGLISKYKITDTEELEAIKQGIQLTKNTSAEYKNLFTQEGTLRAHVAADLSQWRRPPEVQRLAWQKKTWEEVAGSVINNPKYTMEEVFENQAKRVFGLERETLPLWAAGSEDMDLMIKDALLNQGKIIRGLDTRSWHYLAPTRKVFGGFEERFGAFTNVYEKAVGATKSTNIASQLYLDMFHAMLAKNGLGEKLANEAFKHNFLPAEWKRAGELVVELDKAQSINAGQEALQAILEKGTARTQAIVKTFQEYTDYLYSDYLKVKIPQLVAKLDMTDVGKIQFENLFTATRAEKNASRFFTETLSERSNLAYEDKLTIINNVLDILKTNIAKHPEWLKEFDFATQTLSDEGKAKISNIAKELTLKEGQETAGLPNYLNNYSPRIFIDAPRPRGRVSLKTPDEMSASFEHSRAATTQDAELITDLEKIVSIRLRGQAKTLYLYPEHEQIMKYSKEFFPPNLKAYTEHYMDRVIGRASPIDQKVADVVNATFGTSWGADRVMQLSYAINDLIYMGGIGFKPFSALRNYFQPLLTVPADLGGTRDLIWLAKGIKRTVADASFRDYMKTLGVIAEYTPDLLFKPNVISIGKELNVLGKSITLPTSQKIRDLGMWLFKNSDAHTRYVAGGAALEKWEYYIRKFARKDADNTWKLGGKALEDFKKKLNLGSREKWTRIKIEKLLSSKDIGAVDAAKDLWVKDVVNDTQFLYGVTDSPLINQVGGGITRTAMVFQSWWMNYGSLLSKWASRSGTVEASAARMFSWMLSSSIAYAGMSTIWGPASAARAVGAGPFPLDPTMPPSWKPVIDAFKLAVEAGSLPFGMSSTDELKSRMKSIINSSLIFVPGGLQLKKTVPAIAEGDVEKILKSIIQMNSNRS
jgi:hypothetical protein